MRLVEKSGIIIERSSVNVEEGAILVSPVLEFRTDMTGRDGYKQIPS